jgi:hypothetical protein
VCASGKPYHRCCGWRVDAEQGGVLWPLYHLCECDNPFDRLTNPKGGGGGGSLVLLPLLCTSEGNTEGGGTRADSTAAHLSDPGG